VAFHLGLVAALTWNHLVAGLEGVLYGVRGSGTVGVADLEVVAVEVGVGLLHVVELLVNRSNEIDLGK
jgi:hypothetical protein